MAVMINIEAAHGGFYVVAAETIDGTQRRFAHTTSFEDWELAKIFARVAVERNRAALRSGNRQPLARLTPHFWEELPRPGAPTGRTIGI